jgi:hypothetical protein
MAKKFLQVSKRLLTPEVYEKILSVTEGRKDAFSSDIT